jgi:hypothetical protein
MEKDAIMTQRVFGISNAYIDSYVDRTDVDELFRDGLNSGKHIIVYGSSKQGKSSLIRQHILDNMKVSVDCTPSTTLIDIYKSVMRQLHVELEETRTSDTSNELSANAGAKFKLKIPFFGEGETNVDIGTKNLNRESIQFKNIESNLALAQDVTEVIKECDFKGRIIIENFHYLPLKIQKELSFDLRTFEDNNILFVILGIWRERNRLTQYNGDLIDRLIEIPVEPWSNEDFLKVIQEGEPILNVSFHLLYDRIREIANGSIGVLQELCKHTCLKANVRRTNFNDTIILENKYLDEAVAAKVSDYSSRHMRCLEDFISGDDTKLNLPYYFIQSILEADLELYSRGISKPLLEKSINSKQENGIKIRTNDFNRFFNHLVEYQSRKEISPPLFDFDKGSQSVKIIDSTFIFFIKHNDRDELMNCFTKPE